VDIETSVPPGENALGLEPVPEGLDDGNDLCGRIIVSDESFPVLPSFLGF
jgi:hypothetical protein